MSPTTDRSRGTAPLQDVDVLIVGARSSGIGAARRLRQRTPGSSYAIVEADTSIDGTRVPFRYPGMCAGSEMFTLGHAFRPWTGSGSVADGRETPDRIPDRASESGAEEHIAYGIHVLRASWSGDPAHWVVTLQDSESGALATMSCSFLYLCSGQHCYAEGHTPAWPALIRKDGVKRLPKDSGFDPRSVQTYEPWNQRIGLIPDGDFLHARQSGRPDIMTDRIESFTETGLRLRSGRTLDADVVVTPSGLNLRNVGGIELTVDGAPVEFPHYGLYRGMMLDGVPNLVFDLGSSDAPWTLTADLVSDHVARLVAHMEERGYTAVTPRLSSQPTEPSPVADIFSGQFHRPGDALPFFCEPVAAQELEFTPADV